MPKQLAQDMTMRQLDAPRAKQSTLFRNESELVELSLEAIKSVFAGQQPCIIAKEVGVGRGIADIVCLIGSATHDEPALESLSVYESVILSALRRTGSAPSDPPEDPLTAAVGRCADKSLKRILELDLVECDNNGKVKLGKRLLGEQRIVAIEAKLTRWKDALGQASRYRCYADESYVLLPELHADSAKLNRAQFESLGVGLLTFSGLDLKSIIPATRCHSHTWQREYVISRLLGGRYSV